MAFNPLQTYQLFFDLDGDIFVWQLGIMYDKYGNVLTQQPKPLNGYVPAMFAPSGHKLIRTVNAGTESVTLADHTILGNAASGVVTLNLPTPSQAFSTATNVGQIIVAKKLDATGNAVTLSSTSIDGSPTLSLTTQNSAVQLHSDGAVWRVTAQF